MEAWKADCAILDNNVTALTKQLDEKVRAISRQLMEKGVVTKQLPAREEDCDLLRAAGTGLQARMAQLEAKLHTKIEQLNDRQDLR